MLLEVDGGREVSRPKSGRVKMKRIFNIKIKKLLGKLL